MRLQNWVDRYENGQLCEENTAVELSVSALNVGKQAYNEAIESAGCHNENVLYAYMHAVKPPDGYRYRWTNFSNDPPTYSELEEVFKRAEKNLHVEECGENEMQIFQNARRAFLDAVSRAMGVSQEQGRGA